MNRLLSSLSIKRISVTIEQRLCDDPKSSHEIVIGRSPYGCGLAVRAYNSKRTLDFRPRFTSSMDA